MWILINLGFGGDQEMLTYVVPEMELFEALNTILQGTDLAMIDEVLWFLGNVIGGCREIRDRILIKSCVIDAMFALMNTCSVTVKVVKNIAMVTSNISNGGKLDYHDIAKLVDVAAKGLHVPSKEVLQGMHHKINIMNSI